MRLLPSLVGGAASLSALVAVSADHGLWYRLSRRLDTSVYHGCQDRRSLALTFDDGPGPDTPELLRYLAQQGILGTFFLSGAQVERYPDVARQIHAGGHEIGNHAYSHKPLAPQRLRRPYLPTPGLMYRELVRTQAILTAVCGVVPRLFRAPFGQRWVGLDLLRSHMGLTGVQWTVIGHDWEWPPERVVPYVLERIVPGAIVCLHDGPNEGGNVDMGGLIRGLERMVPALRKQGYRFETVSELLQPTAAGELTANKKRPHISAIPSQTSP